jgi:plasmid maintenance system killer protein
MLSGKIAPNQSLNLYDTFYEAKTSFSHNLLGLIKSLVRRYSFLMVIYCSLSSTSKGWIVSTSNLEWQIFYLLLFTIVQWCLKVIILGGSSLIAIYTRVFWMSIRCFMIWWNRILAFNSGREGHPELLSRRETLWTLIKWLPRRESLGGQANIDWGLMHPVHYQVLSVRASSDHNHLRSTTLELSSSLKSLLGNFYCIIVAKLWVLLLLWAEPLILTASIIFMH